MWSMNIARAIAFVLAGLSVAASGQTYITYSNAGSLSQVWTQSMGSAVTTQPVVQQIQSPTFPLSYETLFLGVQGSTHGFFYGLKADDGTTLWSFNLPTGVSPTGTPILVPGASGTRPPLVVFLASNGCAYAVDMTSSGSASAYWSYCPSGYTVAAIAYDSYNIAVYAGINPSSGAGYAVELNLSSGTAAWTSTSLGDQVVAVAATGGWLGGGVTLTTLSALYQLDTSGSVLGSPVSMPETPTASLFTAVIGDFAFTQDLCPPAYDNRLDFAIIPAGSSVYYSQLSASGPGALQYQSLGYSITAASAYDASSIGTTRVHRDPDSGLLVGCTTGFASAISFSPLSNGSVAGVRFSWAQFPISQGAESASVSAVPLYYLLDETSFTAQGTVLAASGDNVVGVRDPIGAHETIWTDCASIVGYTSETGVVSVVQRIYFADSAGGVYAISPGGI